MKIKKKVSYSLQLLIQLQKLSHSKRESGYALLMASMISILIFSMLTVYLFSTRLTKSTTTAMIDSGSTFYAAEFGLNKRANDMRLKVGSFSRPNGISPTDTSSASSSTGVKVASMMRSCISGTTAQKGSGDFACQQDTTAYKESKITHKDGQTSSSFVTSANTSYNTFSFVQDISPTTVALTVIPANNNFAGLRATDYQYRVYSTAVKQANSSEANVQAQAMLQMQFIDRFIPIFQFAAFYEGNMDINTSTTMTITGPIHSNASIYLAPAELLTLGGNVSYVNNIYKSLAYKSTGGSATGLRSILFAGGTPTTVSSSGAWGAGPFPIAIDATDITASNSVRRTGALRLPPSGFLSKNQSNGSEGTYYNKADLRVDFDPCNKISPCDVSNAKFNITRMNQTGTTPVEVEKFSDRPGLLDSLQKPVVLNVTDGAIGFSEIVRLCPKLDGAAGEPAAIVDAIPPLTDLPLTNLLNLAEFKNPINGLANRTRLKTALQKAIIMTPATDSSLAYANMKSALSGLLKTHVDLALDNAGILDAAGGAITTARLIAIKPTITSAKPVHIAALNTNNLITNINGGCILPAPMQILRNTTAEPLYDKREARNMYILQSNIKSLTVWNRDGVYGDITTPAAQTSFLALTTLSSASDKLFTKRLASSLAAIDQFANLNTTNSNNSENVLGANCDYDCLGLGSVDGIRSPTAAATSQGGMVWHYSLINRTDPPYAYVSNPSPASPAVAVRDASKGLSSYGFAFSGGARLPGALTIASDQAVYVQGDYNNPSKTPGSLSAGLDASALAVIRTTTSNPPAKEKRPAAIMGDSAIMLSNDCSTNFKLSCLKNGSILSATSDAVVRAAILSGTEATNTAASPSQKSGGVNNHVGFREDWSGQTFKYRGSLVSKGIPSEFNGLYRSGCSGSSCGADIFFYPPARDFGFDADFNSVDGLPPLTPNVNLLIQKVYKRDYDSENRG